MSGPDPHPTAAVCCLCHSLTHPSGPSPSCSLRLPYEERAKLAANLLGARCLEIMARKQTNLSVAADVDTAEEMLLLADQVSGG